MTSLLILYTNPLQIQGTYFAPDRWIVLTKSSLFFDTAIAIRRLSLPLPKFKMAILMPLNIYIIVHHV
jgi:hypothetical protein